MSKQVQYLMQASMGRSSNILFSYSRSEIINKILFSDDANHFTDMINRAGNSACNDNLIDAE